MVRSDRWVSVLERPAHRTGATLGPRNPHSPTAGSVLCAMSLGAKAGKQEGRGGTGRRGEDEGRGSTKGRAEGNVLVRAGAGRDGAGQLQAVGVALLGASAGLCLSVCLSSWEGGQEHMHRGPARHLGLMPSPAAALGLWL